MLSAQAVARRRTETFDAASEIHGATPENPLPASAGLLDTVEKKCPQEVLIKFVSTSKKFKNKVFSVIFKTASENFERSEANKPRSIAVYYSKGVMGKRKYRSIYRCLSMMRNVTGKSKTTRIKVLSSPLPRLVPYNKLAIMLNEIEIGTLYSVRSSLCDDLDGGEKVDGCYRKLNEFLPMLASFYLSVLPASDIDWFNEPYTFQVAIGGDGAPFGKFDQSCAWLVSFLNIGHKILSSEDNFLIFGSNCSETSPAVTKYISMVAKEIEEIEKASFKINNLVIKFKFSEIPNDMKMLAYLAGELPNSAKYFSTFGNVCNDDLHDVSKTFGPEPPNAWKPWDYKQRVVTAKKVHVFKTKLNKKPLTEKTKRSKITGFIAGCKSRQEFEPPIGRLIDKAHADPLYVKNNACQLIHKQMLYEAIAKSALGGDISNFKAVPCSSAFYKFICVLKQKCQLSRLANKIIHWFNETKAKGSEFSYRFTGRDSRMFLHNFMYLVSDCLESPKDSLRQKFRMHVFAYIALQLRNAISLFSRMTISDSEIQDLTVICRNYYRANALFIGKVTPTVWTVGHVIPVHTQDVKSKHGKGLTVNSMEGREAKHIAISRYAKNSTYSNRWQLIFRHEYISLIWLRERGYNLSNYAVSKEKYIPKRVGLDGFCECGCWKEVDVSSCGYCSHSYRKSIELSCKLGKINVDKCLL